MGEDENHHAAEGSGTKPRRPPLRPFLDVTGQGFEDSHGRRLTYVINNNLKKIGRDTELVDFEMGSKPFATGTRCNYR